MFLWLSFSAIKISSPNRRTELKLDLILKTPIIKQGHHVFEVKNAIASRFKVDNLY